MEESFLCSLRRFDEFRTLSTPLEVQFYMSIHRTTGLEKKTVYVTGNETRFVEKQGSQSTCF